MKKISESHRWWLEQRDALLVKRSRRRAGLARNDRASRLTRWRTAVIAIPAHLIAERAVERDRLFKIVKSVIKTLLEPNTVVLLDFSRTVKLYPGGTLILLAYLELLLLNNHGRIRARCQPKSLAAQLLRHFGLADQLGIDVADSLPTHESVVNWRYLTGTGAEGEKIAQLLHSYRDLTSVEPPEGLYDVLNEALVNVRHHAYPKHTDIPEDMRRWWLFARFNEPTDCRPGNLYIAVYDIGIGIQNSLRSKLEADEIVKKVTDEVVKWLRLGRTYTLESLLLKRAVEHQRSSTGLPFRGLGLPEMRDFVLQTSTGRLYIISGAAQYSCLPADNVSESVSCNPAFPGTLILWSIPLERKELAS